MITNDLGMPKCMIQHRLFLRESLGRIDLFCRRSRIYIGSLWILEEGLYMSYTLTHVLFFVGFRSRWTKNGNSFEVNDLKFPEWCPSNQSLYRQEELKIMPIIVGPHF